MRWLTWSSTLGWTATTVTILALTMILATAPATSTREPTTSTLELNFPLGLHYGVGDVKGGMGVVFSGRVSHSTTTGVRQH